MGLSDTRLIPMQAFFDGTTKGELLTRLTVDVQRLSAAVADNLGQRGVRSLFEVCGLHSSRSSPQP